MMAVVPVVPLLLALQALSAALGVCLILLCQRRRQLRQTQLQKMLLYHLQQGYLRYSQRIARDKEKAQWHQMMYKRFRSNQTCTDTLPLTSAGPDGHWCTFWKLVAMIVIAVLTLHGSLLLNSYVFDDVS